MDNFKIKEGLQLENQTAPISTAISKVGNKYFANGVELKPAKNYIAERFRDFETYADETVITTQTGITVTGMGCTVESTSAISGSRSLELVTTATNTDNIAVDITIADDYDYGKPLFFSLKTRGSTDYAANDMYAVITEDGTELAHTIVDIPAGDYQVKGFFIPTSGKAYALKIKNDITTASHVLLIDDLYVGTQEPIYASTKTNEILENAQLMYGNSNVTMSTYFSIYDMWYHFDGDKVKCRVLLTRNATAFSSTPGTGDTVRIKLPAGVLGDISKLTANPANYYRSAPVTISGDTTSTLDGLLAGSITTIYSTKNALNLDLVYNSLAFSFNELKASTSYMFEFSAPIEGKSSNIQLADRALVEYAYNTSTTTTSDTTLFGYGLTGALIKDFAPSGTTPVEKRIRFQNGALDTDIIELEYQEGGTGGWVPMASRFPSVNANDAGSTYYGYALVKISSTDFSVFFFSQIIPGVAWSTKNTSKWRVKKTSTGGYAAGPIDARNVVGSISGTVVPSGFINSEISYGRLRSAATALTTATPINLTSTAITLTPGTWEISGAVGFTTGVGTTITALDVSISKTSVTVAGVDRIAYPLNGEFRLYNGYNAIGISGNDTTLSIPTYTAIVTTDTVIYLVVQAAFDVSTLNAYGYYRAKRM